MRLVFVGVLVVGVCLLLVLIATAGLGVAVVVAVAGDDVTLPHGVPLAHAGRGASSSLVVLSCWHLGSTNILKYKEIIRIGNIISIAFFYFTYYTWLWLNPIFKDFSIFIERSLQRLN